MGNHSSIESGPGRELRFWLSVTRRLPQVRGSGRICTLAQRIYNRYKRTDVTVDVLDFKMVLDPSDSMEREFLFAPQIYDRKEIDWLRNHLSAGQTFLDAGANVGFYSLIASRLVGDSGKVICIEANSYNASRLNANLQLNHVTNTRVVNKGLSDRSEMLRLGLNTTGNSGGHSFLSDSPEAVTVECETLTDVLLGEGITRVEGAKMDIEGFEFKVLQRFFKDGNVNLWPKFLIIESNPFFGDKTGGDTLGLLSQNGYSVTRIAELNYVAVRK